VHHHTEAFVGIDTSKSRNAIAIADGGRGGEVRYLGELPSTEAAIRKLIAKLAAKYHDLTFCYEAGPTGYGLYRLLKSLGHECLVVAPSLVPKKAGDRVKTNRRDAVIQRRRRNAPTGDLFGSQIPPRNAKISSPRCSTVVLHRQKPAVREAPDFEGLFAA
jgi:transposase